MIDWGCSLPRTVRTRVALEVPAICLVLMVTGACTNDFGAFTFASAVEGDASSTGASDAGIDAGDAPPAVVDPDPEGDAMMTMVEDPVEDPVDAGTDASVMPPDEDDAGAVISGPYEECVVDGGECGSLECRELSTNAGRWCAPTCAMAEDCPVPLDGTAVPTCDGFNNNATCRLDCTGTSCPSGMICEETSLGGGMGGGAPTLYFSCIWVN